MLNIREYYDRGKLLLTCSLFINQFVHPVIKGWMKESFFCQLEEYNVYDNLVQDPINNKSIDIILYLYNKIHKSIV